ncbi:MAG: 50S ribosomal protein L2 [Candidatus Harrisonbacteria bacterium]|nr:50S ribosomal protein L2 [Candidatus Harrisonbacteria bacterium]
MKKYKPTTKSLRGTTVVDYSSFVTTKKPFKRLTERIKQSAGRNHHGRITMRHQGGGNKKTYRTIDFKQDRFNIPARVETIEYSPYHSAFIALVVYKDGLRSYILATKDVKVGDILTTSEDAKLTPGNRLPLKKIPVGYSVNNVELTRGTGGKIARSAGTSVEILAHDAGYTDLKLGSRAVRKVSSESLATIGQISNIEWSLVKIGKAGRNRWLGVRPTVRGTAMNPVDHPYGGGEQKQPRGTKRPKDIWGNITGGRKTRKRKKWSDHLIVSRRINKVRK